MVLPKPKIKTAIRSLAIQIGLNGQTVFTMSVHASKAMKFKQKLAVKVVTTGQQNGVNVPSLVGRVQRPYHEVVEARKKMNTKRQTVKHAIKENVRCVTKLQMHVC